MTQRKLQKIHQLPSGAFRFEIFGNQSKTYLLLDLQSGSIRASKTKFVESEKTIDHRNVSLVRKLRKELVGSRIRYVATEAGVTEICLLISDGSERRLRAGKGSLAILGGEKDFLSGRNARHIRNQEIGKTSRLGFDDIFAMQGPKSTVKAPLRAKRERKLLKRLERKICRIQADMNRAKSNDRLKLEADLLMANLDAIDGSPERVVLRSFDQKEDVEILLGQFSPHSAAEDRYRKVRRFREGERLGQVRVTRLEQERRKLKERIDKIEKGEISPTPDSKTNLRFNNQRSTKKNESARLPYFDFHTVAGCRILVGRSAKENDIVTKNAHAKDIWLHARGVSGSHVILKCRDHHSECFLDAAMLAGHNSPLANERKIEVDHTERRFVYKKKGSPPGMVFLRKHKTTVIQMEPGRVKRILERTIN